MALSRPGFCFRFAGIGWLCCRIAGLTIRGVTFDAHTLLFSSLAILMGYQSALFAICAKAFAIGKVCYPRTCALIGFSK